MHFKSYNEYYLFHLILIAQSDFTQRKQQTNLKNETAIQIWWQKTYYMSKIPGLNYEIIFSRSAESFLFPAQQYWSEPNKELANCLWDAPFERLPRRNRISKLCLFFNLIWWFASQDQPLISYALAMRHVYSKFWRVELIPNFDRSSPVILWCDFNLFCFKLDAPAVPVGRTGYPPRALA